MNCKDVKENLIELVPAGSYEALRERLKEFV